MAHPSPPSTQLRPRVTYLVGRLNRVLRRRLGEALVAFKLSIPQYTTLSVLHARGNLSNAELAKRAFISPQAMNEVIQGLEARRLVTRRASASHGRIVQLLLTQRGLEVMHACDAAVHRLEQSMLSGLVVSQRRLLAMALTACAHSLEHPNGAKRSGAPGSGRRRRAAPEPADPPVG